LLFKNFILCLLFQLPISLNGALFTNDVGVGFFFFDWLWIHAVLTLALMLPLSLGGMGIREFGLIGLLGLIGIGSEQALAVSFGFLTLQIIQALTGLGTIFVVSLQKAKKNKEE